MSTHPAAPAAYRRPGGLPAPPAGLPHALMLTRRPAPAETGYVVASAWAETVAGRGRRTCLTRTLGLRVAPAGAQLHCTLRPLVPPHLHPPPTSFDELALRLAGLYAELVLEVAPTGELRKLANAAAIRHAWAGLRPELLAAYPPASQVVDDLVTGIDQQLAGAAGLWPSLAYDYAYAALLGDFYQQPFDTHSQYQRARIFPQFFDGLALHFTETLRLDPTLEPDRVVLHLRGELNRAATDMAAIAGRMRAALGLAEAIDPAEVAASYQATHTLDRATGQLLAAELTVRCTHGDQYAKEYFLTIQPYPLP